MKTGRTNFARALGYLRANGLVHNQKDLADRIGSTPTTISRNKHGVVGYTDEETITKFNAVFGDIINIAYLRGESDIMLVSDLSQQEKINTGVNSNGTPAASSMHTGSPDGSSTPDMSSLINAAIAAKDEAIASLKREIAAKDDIIATLHEQLHDRTDLMRSIQQQAADITSKYETLLQEHNNLLRRISVNIDTINSSYIGIAAEPSAVPYGKKKED